METDWSFLGVQLQGTYIQRQLTRTNRNLSLLGSALIVAVGCFGASESRYFYNFFSGPVAMSTDAIAGVKSPEMLRRYFVSVTGDDSMDSGVQYVEKQVSQSGEVESETVKAGYSILVLGKRLLIVKRPPQVNGKEYEGALVDLPADVRSEIITPLLTDYPNAGEVFFPLMLDATGFRDEGYISFAVCIPVFLFALWSIWKVKARVDNPLRHPIIKSLSRYGPIAESARQIDAETCQRKLREVILGPSWLILPEIFSLKMCHVPDVVWAYKKRTKHKMYFVITTGTSYAVVIFDRSGEPFELSATEEKANSILEMLITTVPWAVFGYTSDIYGAARADWAGFVAAVDERHSRAFGSQ